MSQIMFHETFCVFHGAFHGWSSTVAGPPQACGEIRNIHFIHVLGWITERWNGRLRRWHGS